MNNITCTFLNCLRKLCPQQIETFNIKTCCSIYHPLIALYLHFNCYPVSNLYNILLYLQALCESSLKARQSSYSPYSKFKVGASLMCGGSVVNGKN